MASKSSYHRSKNTFRFKTFNERLTAINIDGVRKFGKFTATPEVSDTFFGESLDKWTELNITDHFVKFRKEIQGEVHTLPQLVHHQNTIVDALKTHLQEPNSLALRPLLDLVVQLARDLQSDFYPCFEDFFSIVVSLLNVHHHDAEVLEHCFTCLAYLIKFLWRIMLEDICQIYKLFCPLLGGQFRSYINAFAAETFAFLIRKHKEPESVFHFILKSFDENPEQVDGAGVLLFEMVKGVQYQFHSSCERVFPLLLDQLGSSDLNQDKVLLCYQHMWRLMVKHTSREQARLIWKPLISCSASAHKKWKKEKSKKGKAASLRQLQSCLSLLHIVVSWKQGGLISDTSAITEVLHEVLTGAELCIECQGTLIRTVAALVLSDNNQMQMQHRPKLVKAVFDGHHDPSLVYQFTRDVFDVPLFEKDVLPSLLNYCEECMKKRDEKLHKDALAFMNELLLNKAPIPMIISSGDSLQLYSLNFSPHSRTARQEGVVAWLLNQIKEIPTSIEQPLLWGSINVLPHCRPLDKQAVESFKNVFNSYYKKVIGEDDCSEESMLILKTTVVALYHLVEENEFIEIISLDHVKELLSKHSSSIGTLGIASLYYSIVNKLHIDQLDDESFADVFPLLEENLSSPYSGVRKLTLDICCQFQLSLPRLPDELDIQQPGVFRICLEAEDFEVNAINYREKLIYLRKLEYSVVQNQIPIGPYSQVPLRYLLGALYINFTLLWKPIQELIESHAHGLKRDEFWSVFGKHLDLAATRSEQELFREKPRLNKTLTDDSINTEADDMTNPSLDAGFKSFIEVNRCLDDKPDHVLHRELIWKATHAFPDVCEPKSRLLVPMIFRFLENEYAPADQSRLLYQNIAKKAGRANASTLSIDDEEIEDDNEEEQEEDGAAKSDGDRKRVRKASNKALLAHMYLLSKFRTPKSLYMEPKLKDLYFEYLQHSDPSVQKVAFDCLTSYKWKYLTPYVENFERLLDNKTFKNEIVLFNIDEESSVVQSDHRADLMPILLSVLYGKMKGQAGKDTAGKAHSQLRKNIILRFLAGAQPNELTIFLDIVFAAFKCFITTRDNVDSHCREIIEDIDPAKIVPLKKQHGLLNTMDVIVKKLGSHLGDYLPNILQVLVGLLGSVSTLLDRREELAPKFVNALKTIRNLAQVKVVQFFENFDFYNFTQSEINAIFRSAVWPQLDKLHLEGVHSPTPLLKLFSTWGQDSRFFILLGKHHEDNPELTPLTHVFKLLHSSHCHDSVSSVIMVLAENLLKGEDDGEENMDEGHDRKPLPVTSLLDGLAVKSETPIGTQLLLPHIPSILSYLRIVVQDMVSGKNKKVLARELNILSMLSSFVEDANQSSIIVGLLLGFLSKSFKRKEQVELDILSAARNLIKQASKPTQFLTILSRLFSILQSRLSRSALCEVVQALGDREESCKELARIVTKLNAWDPRRVDEPDYMVRLEGFQKCQQLLTSTPWQELDIPLLLMVLHNCVSFLATTDDMSLRDSSSFYMSSLVEKIGEAGCESTLFKSLIQEHLIAEVKSNLKNEREVSRHEFINILGCLTKTFPSYQTFVELAGLTDNDVDMDFFANITHIQMHRRARALKRLGFHLEKHTMVPSTFNNFIIPIVTAFIKDECYLKWNNLQDTAVDTLGAVCRVLPWQSYQIQLRNYIHLLPKSLTNQRLMVRATVTVLNSFHFDISNSKFIAGNAPKKDVSRVVEETLPGQAGIDEEVNDDEEIEDDSHDTTENKSETTLPLVDKTEGILDSKVVCNPELSTKIHKTIVNTIIPKLHKSLTQKASSDDVHKMAQAGKYAEDDEILRVPLALAMIKLLQNLPKGTLEQNLPNVILKVCQFLKSRAKDIRVTARDTLIKIMQTLGVRCMTYVLREMRSTLKRGYQVHVLCYTVWALLNHLDDSQTLKSGDLDVCMSSLVEVFNLELFSNVAEEKEVAGITGKLLEAKSSKSFDSYQLLAKYISESSLSKIIVPLKEILDNTNSHKTSQKVSNVLTKCVHGLGDNTGVETEVLLKFVYGLVNEALPMLKPPKANTDKGKFDPREKPTNALLLTPEPKRATKKAKVHIKTNMYIIVEFGLQLLHTLLRKSKLVATDSHHLSLLEPFVESLTSSLGSKHIKVTTIAMRCMMFILKFPLPSLKQHISSIVKQLFVLLNTYAGQGAAKGDNFELVVMCFKAVTIVVKEVKYYQITKDQLQVLLSYAEQDLNDYTRQATAFSLLKAILSRKLEVPEVHEVMARVEQLAITSEQANVRLQCRQVVMQFLLDYPLGKAKLNRHLEMFVTQLQYEHETGRESALEMMATMFSSFPQGVLVEYSGFFFVPLASRLVNDDSQKCKKLAALAIKSLLNRLEINTRDSLFDMGIQWIQDSRVSFRKLAALVIGQFVEVETTNFERHLKNVLPIISSQIHVDKYESQDIVTEVDDEKEAQLRDEDHLLFALLNLVTKLLKECNILRKAKWLEPMQSIWEHIFKHLLHPHTWVRLASSQLIGLMFGSWTPEDLYAASKDSKSRDYILCDFDTKLYELCGSMCKVLAAPKLENDLADQVVKNLVFLAKILRIKMQEEGDTYKSENETNSNRTSLMWLLKRSVKEAKFELSSHFKTNIKRKSVFKLLAAVAMDLGKDLLPKFLSLMLTPVVTEFTNNSTNADPDLKSLSQEVLELLKSVVGHEVFTTQYAATQRALFEKRDKRKRDKAAEAVSNPELYAKKRIKKNIAKKETKKRKMEEFNPAKKKKRKQMENAVPDFGL